MSDTEKPAEDGKSELFQSTSLPSTPTAPPGALTNPSDITARPGFRSPSNSKSKAMKPGAAKKKK
ncbi:MAG: hypothetical protein Q8P41_08490 [Pseudomonadota bacterium]|nr:hypothetical protein [Pseudomonadota bacterium]